MCAWQEKGRVRKECEEAFAAADEGRKGYLTAEDYKVAILSLFGYKPSKSEVLTVWRDNCGRDGTEGVTKERFISLAAQRVEQQDKDGVARQVFLAFDVGCQGFLTERDCVSAIKTVAPHLSQDRVPAVFREVDRNGDSRVSYRDFELMMRRLTG